MTQPSDDFEYTTANQQAQIALVSAFNEILFWQRMEELMPLVAAELVAAGVDFSKVNWDRSIEEAHNER